MKNILSVIPVILSKIPVILSAAKNLPPFPRHKPDETGASAAIVAVSLTVLVGCAALVTDLGAQYLTAYKLQDAIDCAVEAAGDVLPCANTAAKKAELELCVEDYLTYNGYDVNDLTINYDYEQWGSYPVLYSLRATATKNVEFGFAKALDIDSADVTATAKVSTYPISSSFRAVSVYMTEKVFNRLAPTLSVGSTFIIKVITNDRATGEYSGNGDSRLIRIVTDEDRDNYAEYEGITQPRHEEFFTNGYYGLQMIDGKPTRVGLSVGDSRPIEDSTGIYTSLARAMYKRFEMCESTCNCTFENHAANCPRIALLPVVTDTKKNVTVLSFVAVYLDYIDDGSSGNTAFVFRYLNDYREESDVSDPDFTTEMTEYTVCTKIMSE